MSLKKKRIAKGVGGSLLAAATVVSGLSVGAGGAVAAPESKAATGQYLILKAADGSYNVANTVGAPGLFGHNAPSYAEAVAWAQQNNAQKWNYPVRNNEQGRISRAGDGQGCLVFKGNWQQVQGVAAFSPSLSYSATCTAPSAGTAANAGVGNSWVVSEKGILGVGGRTSSEAGVGPGGRNSAPGLIGAPAALSGGNRAAVNFSAFERTQGTTSPVVDPANPPGGVENGGVVAQPGPAVTLDRAAETEVRVGTKATAQYTSADQKVTITAPAGTSFAAGQTTVAGAWSKNGTSFDREPSLNLTNVSVSGNTMTGTFKSSGDFTQGKDYQLAWYPKLTVNAGATAGKQDVAFGVTGATNLGSTNVTGNTEVTIPVDLVVAPLAITTPADGSTVSTPSNRITFAGTGEPGARVQVKTTTDRTIIDTFVGANGQWSQETRGDLAFDVDYVLVTEYTVGSQSTKGEHRVRLENSDPGVIQAPRIDTPAAESTVIAPTGRVGFAGVGTTGTKVTIHPARGLDRVVAQATIGKDGKWTTEGDLNADNGEYNVFVKYTLPSGTLIEQDRHFFIKREASTDLPFVTGTPAEGSTVTLENFRVGDRNGETTISGTGKTGGMVKVWNYESKNRIVIKGGEILRVDENGKWSGVGELRDQGYELLIEYFAPGADLNGQPTKVVTRTFTTVAPTR